MNSTLAEAKLTQPWISLQAIFTKTVGAALESYGAAFVLVVLGIIGLFWLHEKLWLSMVAAKDAEIARIAAQRDRLETFILKDRKGADLDEAGEPRNLSGGKS